MEGVAIYAYASTEEDELSFQKSDILKIISLQEDRNWFKAELNERIGFVPKNYVKLKANYWYVGNMPRLQAESFLLNNHRDKPNGSFLVRDSESVPNTCNFSLSVKYNNKVQHYKIVNSKNKYILWQYLFNSLNELVSFYKHNSIAKNYPLTLVECIFPKNLRKLRSVRSFVPTNAGEIGFEADEEILLIDGSHPTVWRGRVNRYENFNIGIFPRDHVAEKSSSGKV